MFPYQTAGLQSSTHSACTVRWETTMCSQTMTHVYELNCENIKLTAQALAQSLQCGQWTHNTNTTRAC